MALTLRERLERTETQLRYLTDKFPGWELWGSSYGPGNTPPAYYSEIRRLEKEREKLILRLANSGRRNFSPEPGAPDAPGKSQRVSSGMTPSKKKDPEVAKRRAIVKGNPGVPNSEMCETFDRGDSSRTALMPPVKWQDAGYRTWGEAYKDPGYRKKIDVIIAKDRKSD